MPRPRESEKEKCSYPKQKPQAKNSPIVLEHYYTSEDFGGHPKEVKSRVVHWNSIMCKAIESLSSTYTVARFKLTIS